MFKNEYINDPVKRAQHEAVRNTVGWYDWTHRVLEVTGPDATAFLDYVFLSPVAKTKVGGAKYSTMLNEEGTIIDDVVIFRLEENKYWVSTLYMKELIAWLNAHKASRLVEYKDITGITRMYAVQGPKSRELLNAILAKSVDGQKFFTITDNGIDGIPVKVARGGYSGEWGYEIYTAPEHAGVIESRLGEPSKKLGGMQITELQVSTLTLPCEKGFALMSDLGGTNPLEAGFDGGIDWNKDFIGKAALEKVQAEGPKRQLLGFAVDEDDIHIASKNKGGPGEAVILNGEEVGRVTKVTYSYTIEKNIGFALVDRAKAKAGDRVTINGHHATLTDRIWYDAENNKPFGR